MHVPFLTNKQKEKKKKRNWDACILRIFKSRLTSLVLHCKTLNVQTKLRAGTCTINQRVQIIINNFHKLSVKLMMLDDSISSCHERHCHQLDEYLFFIIQRPSYIYRRFIYCMQSGDIIIIHFQSIFCALRESVNSGGMGMRGLVHHAENFMNVMK